MADEFDEDFGNTGGGILWASFPDKGAVFKGIVKEKKVRQSRSFDDGTPEVWDDGTPKKEFVAICDTEYRDDEKDDDDGTRQVVMRRGSNLHRAVVEAIQKAGATGLEVGGTIVIKYTGDDKPKQKGMRGAKKYAAKWSPPKPKAEEEFDADLNDEALDNLDDLLPDD